jgi:membrane-bound serine protease (ClpP class)
VLPAGRRGGTIARMKSAHRIILLVVAGVLLLSGRGTVGEPDSSGPDSGTVRAVVVTCKDMIDDGLYKSIKRRTQSALDDGVEYVIYEIDTFGGDLFSAYNISEYLLHEVNSETHTVAYVSKKAISAGALISVACEDILMKEKTRIGDCAPISLGGKLEGVEREKIETDTRAAFATSAKANNYPEVLLKAMVTRQIEVYKLKNLRTGRDEFFETVRMPSDSNEYDLEHKELVVKDDELLTLTASEAVQYGVARAQVKNRQGVLDFLAERDGVTFAGRPVVLKTNWSEEMVRWLNSPSVMAVLIMFALLGVYIEFNTPGVGLPGLVAVVCFVIIIGSKYLWGLANWVEVALFVGGIILLLVEIFLLPGFGVAGVLGIVCIMAGLFGMLIRNEPGKLPWPETELGWQLFMNSLLGLVFGFLGFIMLAWVLARYLPRLQFLSGLVLVPTTATPGSQMRVSMTTEPDTGYSGVSVGQSGQVVSKLRPAGKARFGEAIVDVVAEGGFIDKGSKVRIIKIQGNRVIVRSTES